MKHLEDALQMQVCEYLLYQHRELSWFAVPNGGKRNAREAARLKKMGVRAGVADLIFSWPNGKGAIELKIGKNNQTAFQKNFEQQWIYNGGQYAVCRDFNSVINTLRSWKAIK